MLKRGLDGIEKIIQQYQVILTWKLMWGQERRAFVEVVMILLVGILWGLYNPNQVAEQLGINPNQLYARLKELSARQWRRLLDQMILEAR
ncbi:MAG: helix-turn-helix domain-containing protein [candidate division WOR-3 bacterium]